MIQVTILSRHQCELCDVVLNMARRLQATTPFGLNHVNIDADAQLLARYGSRVPVLLIDQVEIGSGAITEADLRRAIKRARWRKPISRILSRLRATLRRGRAFLLGSSYPQPPTTHPRNTAAPAPAPARTSSVSAALLLLRA